MNRNQAAAPLVALDLDPATKRLFLAAIEVDADCRDDWLEQACPDDDHRRAEVRSLLASERATLNAMLESCRAAPAPLEEGRRVDRYIIERRLGEGGFSEVYLAHETGPASRSVALKVLRPGIDDASLTAALMDEVGPLAILSHPGIAVVHATGRTDDGRPFIAMEHVPGRPVTRFAREASLDLHDRVQLVILAAEAVQHAHVRGVVHRDLKPANLLAFRDDAGDLRVKVIDFGIALLRHRSVGDQPTSAPPPGPSAGDPWRSIITGTPGYMAPEQIVGGAADVRSDVHALGVVLHELLTDAPAFGPPPSSGDHAVLLDWIESRRIARPSTTPGRPEWRRELARDLDWIVQRCVRVDQADRYQSAGALAADLRRWQDRLPVRSRPNRIGYRTSRLLARHPWVSAAAVGATFMLIAALIATSAALAQSRRDAADRAAALGLAEDRATALGRETRRVTNINTFLREILAGPATWSLAETVGVAAPDVRIRDLLEQTSARIPWRFATDADSRLALRVTLAETWIALERMPDARRELEVIDADPDLAGLSAGLRADVERIRGDLLAAKGRLEESLQVHRDAAALAASDGASVAWGWNANIVTHRLWRLGRHDEARRHASEVVAACLIDPGETHLLTATALNNQAALEPDVEASLAALDHAVRVYRLAGQAYHRDALVARANRLTCLRLLGRFEELSAASAGLLADRRRVLGDGHSHTLASWIGEVHARIRTEKLEDAEGMLAEILPLVDQLPDASRGDLSVSAREAATNIALLREDGPGAIRAAEDLVLASRDAFGDDDVKTAVQRFALARALALDGRILQSEELLAELEGNQQLMQLQGGFRGLPPLAFARVAAARGDADDAASLAADALDHLEPGSMPGDPNVVIARRLIRGPTASP